LPPIESVCGAAVEDYTALTGTNNNCRRFCYLGNVKCSFQPDGVNSAILLAGWVLTRSSTSQIYSKGFSLNIHDRHSTPAGRYVRQGRDNRLIELDKVLPGNLDVKLWVSPAVPANIYN
jgi:hypothetical protein